MNVSQPNGNQRYQKAHTSMAYRSKEVDINQAQRSRKALQLRSQGMSLREVAERCGYADKSGAYRAISRELDRLSVDDVEHLRGLEATRLDELLQTFGPKARGGDYRAAEIVLSTIQVRCKILGLNVADREPEEKVRVVVREIPSQWLLDETSEIAIDSGNHHQEGMNGYP